MRQFDLIPAVIGKDGRTSAIESCLRKSPRVHGDIRNGRRSLLLTEWKNEDDPRGTVLRRARELKPDFVIVGPEEPLAEGVVDLLQNELGIPCIGPTQSLSLLESSKSFTRELLAKYSISGNPEFKVFHNADGVKDYLEELGQYVIKPDGLTGGKGVKVSDVHLFGQREAVEYCQEIFDQQNSSVVIEEKLEGEEFSLQSFCDGIHVKHMIVVQDHKRAYDGDLGPNTGGMGSYSCANHSLPFLTPPELRKAQEINEEVAQALFNEQKRKYKGILYGGFMATRNGVRLIEYNARFGDPEALNVLSLLKTDLVDICEAIIEERLHELSIHFDHLASVCKYVVPEGYPDSPVSDVEITGVPEGAENLRVFPAAIKEKDGKVLVTGSRAVAFVGIGKDLIEAQKIAEEAASSVKGRIFHRKDIGTHKLIQQRIDHMKALSASTHDCNPHTAN